MWTTTYSAGEYTYYSTVAGANTYASICFTNTKNNQTTIISLFDDGTWTKT